jgi:hypothetical protein
MKPVSASRLASFSVEGKVPVSIGQEAAMCVEEKDLPA